MMDKMIVFDLEGFMAHFRKFYTNSSSLSYAFPPRTTIIGLVAGILGLSRDSYYDMFSSEKCNIALSIKVPVRKLVQTVNYLRVTREAELNGSGGRTQVPVEFVLPLEAEVLRYRVYFCHKDKNIMNRLKSHLETGDFVYPPYLGITECLGMVNLVDGEAEFLLCKDSDRKVDLQTVVPVHKVQSVDFAKGLRYMIEDRVPVDFNVDRTIKKVHKYMYEHSCNPMKGVVLKDGFFRVTYRENGVLIEEFGVFME